MVISKERAAYIAKSLTEPKKLFVEKLDESFRIAVTQTYKDQIPEEVWLVYKNHPDFLETSGEIILDGHGFNWVRILTSEDSVITNNNRNAILKMTRQSSAPIYKMFTTLEKERAKLKQFVNEVKSALINLKTTTRIAKELPEAIPFLPVHNTLAVQVNVKPLRDKINNQ